MGSQAMKPTPEVVRAVTLHPLSDLSAAWPPFFVENLYQVFTHGAGKSGSKFQVIRKQLTQSLPSAPSPGPATFVVNCLEVLLHVKPPYNEGLSHLLLSSLSQLDQSKRSAEDASNARLLAVSLFINALNGSIKMEPRIVVKLPVIFGFKLENIGESLPLGDIKEDLKLNKAKDFLERYVLHLLKARSYTSAVSLLKCFDLDRCDYQSLIKTIVDEGQTSLAVDWAAHLGTEMLKFLIQYCTESGLFKAAYRTVKQYQLEQDFPDAYYLYRQSTLHKLVYKGSWDVAQSIAEEDSQLVDYLVNLALENNEPEKVAELCEYFGLDQISISPELLSQVEGNHYLQLESLVQGENVFWIDTKEGLEFAQNHLVNANVVGIDCEWKATKLRGAAPNKVSILQVAIPERVFVIDLITLSKETPYALNDFIKVFFHSSKILKLGYAIHNDFERLLHSYKEVEAFQICESFLDLQRVFGRQTKGGLSNLSKNVLGSPLNKQIRMSDWECRPLTKKQLHYAALDAAVLLPIYRSIASEDWKSSMMTFRVHSKKRSNADIVGNLEADNTRNAFRSHEDLVLATCELLGLPIPGLMKAELLQLTTAEKLQPPIYSTASFGSLDNLSYSASVNVAGTTYFGYLSSSRKDAEFWAAHVALTKLRSGISKLENMLSSKRQVLYCYKAAVRLFPVPPFSCTRKFGTAWQHLVQVCCLA